MLSVPIIARTMNWLQLLAGLFKFAANYIDEWDRNPAEAVTLRSAYDFIIVGAGSAGCVLANRLTENPQWNVLLIEAGSDENLIMDIPLLAPLLQLSSANWNYTAEPSNNYCLAMTEHRCRLPRGRVVGGSSVLNSMIFTRGNRRDYDKWAEMGNTEWAYRKVLPYFKKLESFIAPGDSRYRNSEGPLSVSYSNATTDLAKALMQANLDYGLPLVDYNGETQTGASYIQANVRDGRRHAVSAGYLQPIRNRTNLHIIKKALVHKILFDNTRATGVLVEHHGQMRQITCTIEVILSAGTFGSPQILMLSGVGPAQHLLNLGIPILRNLPVGLNLMDHIGAGLTFKFNHTPPYSIDIVRALDSLPEYFNSHTGILSIPGSCELVAFYDSSNAIDHDGYPDIELLYVSSKLTQGHALVDVFGVDEKHLQDYKSLKNVEGFSIFPMVLRPKSRGYVLLRDTNPKTPPLIVPNYLSHPDDVRTMVKGIRLALKIMREPVLKRSLGVEFHEVLRKECPYDLRSDAYLECIARHYTLTIYHQSGTCRMGPRNDARTVVDQRLRVHGLQGLRVVDASIIPEIIAGHTNGPTVMIAERAADLIKADYDVKG